MDHLIRQLERWQSREWLCRLAWGFARWLGIVLFGLTVAAGIDWTIDRYQDTPMLLRIAMTFTQLAVAAAAGVWLLYRLNVPSLDVLAAKAEDAYPDFGHRLVTALQLNRPTARTAGMSPQLIAAVTHEAGTLAADRDLTRLTDTDRLRRAVLLLVPLMLVCVGVFVWSPKLLLALLGRQALLPIDIPRSVSVSTPATELHPSGDAVTLKFAVAGRWTEQSSGVVLVTPDDGPAETYELTFAATHSDGTATFTAAVPPASVAFNYSARLHDGRTRTPGRVTFAPRPVVTDVNAWLRLPAYVDPDGRRRYERFQPQGEVTALPGCGMRVSAVASHAISSANLVLLGRDAAGNEKPLGDPISMTIAADGKTAEASLELLPKGTAYRIHVTDANQFTNLNPPRRGIVTTPDESPRVNLLAEVIKDPRDPGPIDDYDATGMPLVLGGRVLIGYAARSPLGLAKAFVFYRVNDDTRWTPLPLTPTIADAQKLGKFIPELGVFENSGPFGAVEFYRVPSADVTIEPDGLEAGGRINFETAALKKTVAGADVKLEVGDRVEFYVAVHDRNPEPSRPPGRSESRIKAVVTQSQLEDWNRQRDQSRERLKQLEDRQRGVFGRPDGRAENPFRQDPP